MTQNDIETLYRELSQLRSELSQRLDKIEEQTTKHNGRMTTAETHLAMLKGGLIVLATLVPFVTAVVVQQL
jgi:hypothetical protein